MKNPFFLIYTFGLGGKHVASPIPLQGKLESAATLSPEPEGLPSGNGSFSLPPSIGEQGGGRKGYAVDRVKGEEKNETGQDGRRTEENQWTWPKMQWRDGRGEGRGSRDVGGGGKGIPIPPLPWTAAPADGR